MIDALLRSAVLRLSQPEAAPRSRLLSRARAAAFRVALDALLTRRHLGEILESFSGTGDRSIVPVDAQRVAAALRRTGATCLHRALGGYAALRARAVEVTFVLGVRAAGDDLQAHAWLERGGVPLGEPADPRRHYTVALEHPGPGAAHTMAGEPVMTQLVPHGDVILTELRDGTGVLLHLGTKFYYALNATGVAAWKALGSGQAGDAAGAVRSIVERFAGAEPEAVRRDVDRLLSELAVEGLVSRVGSPARPGLGA